MEIILCGQVYNCDSGERQCDLARCLRRNLQNPCIDRAILWVEASAPALPVSRIPIEIIALDRRLSYDRWLRQLPRHPGAILLLANADIVFDATLERLPDWLPDPRCAVALSRWEAPQESDAGQLRADPHWSQDSWALRSDALLDDSLLQASALPIGVPGCDNRFAHVLWSHGYRLANPCHHIRSLHRHRPDGRSYDRSPDRLIGTCTHVHPALTLAEPSELEHVIWSRSPETGGALTLQLEGEQAAVWSYRRSTADPAAAGGVRPALSRLLERGWPLGTASLAAWRDSDEEGSPVQQPLPLPAAIDQLPLPLHSLFGSWLRLELEQPTAALAVALRLPAALAGCPLSLQSQGPSHGWSDWSEALVSEAPCAASDLRLLLPPFPRSVRQLRLRLGAAGASPPAVPEAVAELRLIVAGTPPEVAVVPDEPLAEAPGTGLGEGDDAPTRFGSRFEIQRLGAAILWRDRYWPTSHRAITAQPLPPLPDEREALFRRGFVRPLLDWRAEPLPQVPPRSQALLAWDCADPTEAEACRRHAALGEPLLAGEPCAVYLGLPWARFAALGRAPDRLLAACGARLEAVAEVLAGFGRELSVHSVCQHRHWRDQLPLFRAAGLTDLWLPHKPAGLEHEQGLRLHPWPCLKPPTADRGGPGASGQWLGCHRFVHCPGGPAADPERFWQSLALGRVPVLTGCPPELPPLPPTRLPLRWEEVALLLPELAEPELEAALAAVGEDELLRRQRLALLVSRLARRMTCFRGASSPS